MDEISNVRCERRRHWRSNNRQLRQKLRWIVYMQTVLNSDNASLLTILWQNQYCKATNFLHWNITFTIESLLFLNFVIELIFVCCFLLSLIWIFRVVISLGADHAVASSCAESLVRLISLLTFGWMLHFKTFCYVGKCRIKNFLISESKLIAGQSIF